jgi:hypothetical protein
LPVLVPETVAVTVVVLPTVREVLREKREADDGED